MFFKESTTVISGELTEYDHWRSKMSWHYVFSCYCTVLPAKLSSTNGSTRFFLLESNPKNCFMPSINASSTGGRKGRKIIIKMRIPRHTHTQTNDATHSEVDPLLCRPWDRRWLLWEWVLLASADSLQCPPSPERPPSYPAKTHTGTEAFTEFSLHAKLYVRAWFIIIIHLKVLKDTLQTSKPEHKINDVKK